MVIKEKSILKMLFFFFMLFSLAPNILIVKETVLKPMYVVFAILVVLTIRVRKIKIPNQFICCFFLYFVIQGILVSFDWGIDRLIFNYSFGFAILIIYLSIGDCFTQEDWVDILQKVWVVLFGLVFINDIKQSYRFVEYVELGIAHPYIVTIVEGGINLESTWLVILSLSFFESKKRWIPFGISAVISLIYASKCGIIAVVGVLFIFVFGRTKFDNKKKMFYRKVFWLACAVLSIGVVIRYELVSSFNFLERFENIATDPGTVGRLNMWMYVLHVIGENPFGVGLGNAIDAISIVAERSYTENNLHNIVMQMFVDLGIIGGLFYIVFWAFFLKREIHSFMINPIVGMLFIYIAIGMFQFRGGETIFFSILGIYLLNEKTERQKFLKERN